MSWLYLVEPGVPNILLGIMLGIEDCEVSMPAKRRFKTNYPGVYYIESKSADKKRVEKIFYIQYRRNGKLVEEKAGRQFQDDMTPARAAGIRGQRIEGKQKSNAQKRSEEKLKGGWTIGKLWEEYRENQLNGGSKTDNSRWKLHLKPTLENKEPGKLVKLDTDRIRINLLKKRSPQTVKHVLILLGRIINYGVDRGLISPLPFRIEMPSVDNIKTEDLSPEQLKSLLKILNTTHLRDVANMMKLALFSGMRRGEIFKLKWSDVDFQRGFIYIVEPKGGKSQKIPLNYNSRELLEGVEKGPSEYVFPDKNGNQRKEITRDARKIKEDAGLPSDFRPFHGLRHVYATMIASSGKVDMYTIQKLLTHKTPAMTQRYAHLRDEALKEASDIASQLLKQSLIS